MLLIVAHHFVVNSGVMPIVDASPKAIHSVALYIEGMWGKTGINCFVLITGWFMCKSNITARKFLKLFLEIVFYKILFTAIFAATGYHHYGPVETLLNIWPIWSVNNGFVSCYLVFFLFIPFLNILVNNMTRRQHFALVILSLSIFSVMDTLPFIEVACNYIIWFSVLYILASYMRLYPIAHKHDLRFWFLATAISVSLAVFSVLVFLYLGCSGWGIWELVSDSNRILAVAVGVTSFMIFVNIKIPYNKHINTIAASTFGVLLIHANSDIMRQWLWKDVCDVAGHYNSEYFWLYIIFTPLLVFTACIVIDHIRIRFLEQPVLRWADNIYIRISKRLSSIFSGTFRL